MSLHDLISSENHLLEDGVTLFTYFGADPYHHASAVQDWLAIPGRRIRLHFVPAYCPYLNPIERL